MPAFVHRFAAGHRLRLVVAGGSVNYRGGLTATPVTISTGSRSQRLTLPTTS
jgi:ABC-2 type transport system ATP-binding protein